MYVYKFNSETKHEQPEITADELINKMKTGHRFEFGIRELLYVGIYKLHGYSFVLRDDLHHYVYRQYDQWHSAYAPNRQTLRRLVGGHIDEILESSK